MIYTFLYSFARFYPLGYFYDVTHHSLLCEHFSIFSTNICLYVSVRENVYGCGTYSADKTRCLSNNPGCNAS